MRTLPFAAAAKGLAFAVAIQKGLTTIRFTTADQEVTLGGDVYLPAPGAAVTNLQFPSDGSPSNAEIGIFAKTAGLVGIGDAARGILDSWPITVKAFDIEDPSGGFDLIPNGIIGSVREDTTGMVTIPINGPMALAVGPLAEHFSLTGRESLGDDRCKIPLLTAGDIDSFNIGRGQDFVRPDVATGLAHVRDAYGRARIGIAGTPADFQNIYFECSVAGTTDATAEPSWNASVGGSTVDGSATFITRNAWTRAASGAAIDYFRIVLDALPDGRASDDTWFVPGYVWVRSGALAGTRKLPIMAWDSASLTLRLGRPVTPSDVPAGTQFEIEPGCDQTGAMCESRFSNIINIRDEEFVPPPGFIKPVLTLASTVAATPVA